MSREWMWHLAAACILVTTQAGAQEWWSGQAGRNAQLSNCPRSDMPLVRGCLTLQCTHGTSYILWANLAVPGVPHSASAVLSLDGQPAFTAGFTDNSSVGDPYGFITEIPPEVVAPFLDRFGAARTISLRFDTAYLNDPALDPLTLVGQAGPLAGFRSTCGQIAASGGAGGTYAPSAPPLRDATPPADPARFPTTASLADTGPAATGLARSALAARIAPVEHDLGHPVDLLAELIRFQDGRSLLIASLCDATYFGITGCETHFLTSPADKAPFTPPGEGLIGGGPFWLDLQSGFQGWPDLLVQPGTGGGTFARLHWTAQGYQP